MMEEVRICPAKDHQEHTVASIAHYKRRHTWEAMGHLSKRVLERTHYWIWACIK